MPRVLKHTYAVKCEGQYQDKKMNALILLFFSSIIYHLLIFQEKIEAINQALTNEYEVRRKMLLKRLDVTVQSFGWSDRAKVCENLGFFKNLKVAQCTDTKNTF